MTAEIAVLNKSAVALAADSAVTIGRGAAAKIYNTVNKIFELSRNRPVGIMVYGRLDFMGMPVETVSKRAAQDILGLLQPDFDSMQGDFKMRAEDFIERVATSPIRDMIRAMPKQELATLASSLIEITSLKRKVSRAQESVGGEVDVAVISKSEGFVWTKRKHYFPRELNPRFFARHFNEPERNAS